MFKEKIKNLISPEDSEKKEDKNNKKQIENLVLFAIILIITVLAINYIWNDNNEKEENHESSAEKIISKVEEIAKSDEVGTDLESRLEHILKKIEGVGNVEVLINYSETSTVVAMYNENVTESSTEETDSAGGLRTIIETDTKKEIVYSDEAGNSNPVTEKVIMPKIEGAIVTFEGASNAKVKGNVINAVQAVTGLAAHKIQVFEMKGK